MDAKLCIDCGEPIPLDRLTAKPNTKRCIECQEDAEHAGACQRHRMQHNIRFKCDEVEEMTGEIVKGDE